MRWPWRQRSVPPSTKPEALEARSQGLRALEDARCLDRRVEKVAREAEEIRRTNHIAAAVYRSLGGN